MNAFALTTDSGSSGTFYPYGETNNSGDPIVRVSHPGVCPDDFVRFGWTPYPFPEIHEQKKRWRVICCAHCGSSVRIDSGGPERCPHCGAPIPSSLFDELDGLS